MFVQLCTITYLEGIKSRDFTLGTNHFFYNEGNKIILKH